MEWFLGALRSHPEITFFLSLALGYALGSMRLGTFTLGPVLGTLIVGLAVGQIGVDVSGPMQAAFFLMFLFAIGFRTGPEFFQGLRSSALPQVAITALLCVCALGCTWGLALVCGFDGGTAAGLLAGAQTTRRRWARPRRPPQAWDWMWSTRRSWRTTWPRGMP